MDNPDIFFQIAVRLSDKTLLSLFHHPFRDLIKSLLARIDFFYRRSEHLVERSLENRDADWKRIYYALLKAEQDEGEKNKLLFGLDYLPSALTIIEVYNPEPLPTSAKLVDAGIAPDAFVYLLTSGAIVCASRLDLEGASYMLSSSEENLSLTRLVLSVLRQYNWRQVSRRLEEVVRDALEGGQLKVFELFLEHEMVTTESRFLFWYAARAKDSVRALSYLLRHYSISNRDEVIEILLGKDDVEGMKFFLEDVRDSTIIDHWFNRAINEGKVEVIKYLLGRGAQMPKNKTWKSILYSVFFSFEGRHNLIMYILDTYPELLTVELLKRAASDDPDTFAAVLSRATIDPSPYLIEMLRPEKSLVFGVDTSPNVLNKTSLAPQHDEYNYRAAKIASILARDSRIKVENLSLEEVRLLLWRLGVKLPWMIQGYIRNALSLGVMTTKTDLGLRLEQDDVYGLLLRFIFIKRPTQLELVKWMIENANETFVLAARSVTTHSVAPFVEWYRHFTVCEHVRASHSSRSDAISLVSNYGSRRGNRCTSI